jgi:hypothetical protein
MGKEIVEHALNINRRRFLSRMSMGIGTAALGSLLIPDLFSNGVNEEQLMAGLPHFAPKAKRGDLFSTEWCTVAIGSIRLQTEVAGNVW